MEIESKVEDLQAVPGQVVEASDRIRQLEREKRTVDPGSARFRELSDTIEALADELRRVSAAETDLAHDLAGEDGLPTVAEADQRAS